MFSDPSHNVRQFRLGEGMIVADLGAGSAAYSMAASRAVGASGKVYAVEVRQELVNHAARLAKGEGLHNVEVIWGDVEHTGGTKLATEAVDAVIASNLFFQVEDRQGLAREIARIMKPGGKAMVIDWLETPDQPGTVVTEEAVADMLTAEGLSCGEHIEAGTHHWGMICRKK